MTRALRWMLYRREQVWDFGATSETFLDEWKVVTVEQPRAATRLFLYLKERLER